MDVANRFQEIKVKGFRRLYDVQLELKGLCVLIGANGVGKTSLLDIFGLLAASADGRLREKLSELGGLAYILTLDKSKQLSIELCMSVPNYKPLIYRLTLCPKGV